ncbi:hypothetical protein D3C81_830730 [compost metagenome]
MAIELIARRRTRIDFNRFLMRHVLAQLLDINDAFCDVIKKVLRTWIFQIISNLIDIIGIVGYL